MLITFRHLAMAMAGFGTLVAAAACSSTVSPADRAYSDSMSACERLTNTDERQNCFEAAMKKYQAAKAVENASSCPKNTC